LDNEKQIDSLLNQRASLEAHSKAKEDELNEEINRLQDYLHTCKNDIGTCTNSFFI